MTPDFGTYTLPPTLRPVVGLAQKTFLKRGFFRHKLGKILNVLHRLPVDAEFCGIKFRLYPQDSNIDLGMLLNPVYNLREIEFLRHNTPADGIFVDIGANIGLYSILMAKPHGPAGHVLAIEPNPKILPRLHENIALAKAQTITVIETAVGAQDGEIAFHSMAKSLGGSRIIEGGELCVRVKPLATILAGLAIEKIDTLKIDIEGYEDKALLPFFSGAPKSLWPRTIVIEQTRGKRWGTSVLDYLTAIGYERVGATRSNALLRLKG